ncbi:MAG: HAMP domain-containing sensor histidine kinase, partial [Pseudomonadota bacterium]
NLIRPIMMITQTMTKLADGDLCIPIPAVNRQDEIGDMARSLAVFKTNAEQLQGALERERELNGLQRQFVSMVSHEFRTPLAIIDASAQRIERRLESISRDRIAKGMKAVRRSVGRLTGLMESVLDAAHLEGGRIKFEPGDVAIGSLLKDLVDSHAELYPDREFSLEQNNLPAVMQLDERLIRQVLSNLMSNALKYSPDGSSVRLAAWRDEAEAVCVAVSDEGVGIPKEELDQLFERFFRASTSTGIAGSGIGLHLVRHFVDLHDGTIDVQSTVGVGTTFTVRLPNKVSSAIDT